MPPPPVPARSARVRAEAILATREIAVTLTAVLLVGLGAIQSSAAPPALQDTATTAILAGPVLEPPPAPAVGAVTRADRLPMMAAPVVPAAAPAVPDAAVAAAAPAPPIARWLPTGTGVWLHDWRKSENGDAREVVTQAQRRGLSHLYVQTGSTGKGWIGEEVLSQLMPAVVGTGLSVIAWDFPKLADPEGDARRMALAATWSRPGAARVTAVAPDIETAAEGTRISGEAVRRYYTALRAALPAEIPILATVPWPSEKRIGKYPYAETAPFADAFVPMAYWYNRSPKVVTDTSMSWLAQFGKPVMPVGQGYDGRIDSPSLAADPDPAGSVQAFVDAALAGGAQSISLWSWQTMGPQQWDVLGRAGAAFGPPAEPPAPVAEPAPSLVDQLLTILGR